ncbi:MAG: hypothetical protein QOC77_52 [Thermoleophilaceae bacterium]|jgi:hypothetical protein|nr:hypothetical protein [Thermoleophilaceae bacterium]
MGSRHNGSRFVIGLSLAILMLVGTPAASAFAVAKVRLVNARPGSQPVGLKLVEGTAAPPIFGQAAYGQVTPYVKVSPGSAQITISGLSSSTGGSKAQTTEQLVDGQSYTAVALALGSKAFQIKVYKDGHARGGKARLRVIHAAPELGAPNVRLGQRTIAEKLAFKDATPYLSIAPGSYELSVVAPGSTSAVFSQRVALSAGVATTAIVAGSGGARTMVITATDDTKAPTGAPETGLGGLARGGGPPWLLAALAALLAGALGGAMQLSLARRSGRR